MKNSLHQKIDLPSKEAYRKQYLENAQNKRLEIVSRLPKVRLEAKHIQHCQLVLNRKAMLQNIGPRNTVAELGVNRGDFSNVILKETQPRTLHLVDLWDTDRYHNGLLNEVNGRFKEEIKSGTIQIHRKRSTEASSYFQNKYFDLLYIDTDHSYSTTRDELLAYAPKMKGNGIIAGHDYSTGNWVTSYRYGVIEAVHEFCHEFDWELCYITAEPLEGQSFAIKKIYSGD